MRRVELHDEGIAERDASSRKRARRCEHGAVAEAAVIGIPEERWHELAIALVVRVAGSVVAGGFTIAGTTTANGIATTNGTSWMSLGLGFNGAVGTVTSFAIGDLVVGGVLHGCALVPRPRKHLVNVAWRPQLLPMG